MGDNSNTAVCSNSPVVELVALGFDVVGDSLARAPQRFAAFLQSKEFETALTRGLQAEAQRLMQKSLPAGADTEEFSINMLEASATASVDSMKKKIQASGRYKRMEAEARSVTRAMQCRGASTPLGVWLNEREKKLVVIGIIARLSIAGAVIYDMRTRAGKDVRDFVNNSFVVRKIIGTIELASFGNAVLNFRPSDAAVAFDMKERSGWYSVNAGLQIAGLYNPGAPSLSASLSAELKLSKYDRLHSQSSVAFNPSASAAPTLDWSLSVGLTRNLGRGASLDFTASVKSPAPEMRMPNASGMVVLKVPF